LREESNEDTNNEGQAIGDESDNIPRDSADLCEYQWRVWYAQSISFIDETGTNHILGQILSKATDLHHQ